MAKTLTFIQALQEALVEEMRLDPSVFVLGQDVKTGVLGVTSGLVDEFGAERVVNTVIAENAMAGVAMGASMYGTRPVLEILFSDFMMLAMDIVFNHLGQWRYISGNQYSCPLTIRTAVGAGFRFGYGHSQCQETLLMQAPGLILAAPSTPHDAKGLLKSAIRSDDPVIFFEHKRLMLGGFEGEVPEEDYTVPFGTAAVRRDGKDVTIVATMYMVHEALEAAGILEQEGIEVEIIDPRTIVPLDKETIVESVAKTGRLVVAEESRIRGGLGAEISAMACDALFSFLKAPVKRVAAPMVPIAGSPVLEDLYIPNRNSIVAAVKAIL